MTFTQRGAKSLFTELALEHRIRRIDDGWDVINVRPSDEAQHVGCYPVAKLRMERVPGGYAVLYALGWQRRVGKKWVPGFTLPMRIGEDHARVKSAIEAHLHCIDDLVKTVPHDGSLTWKARFGAAVEAVVAESGLFEDGPIPERNDSD